MIDCDGDWCEYKVELRASPDTPPEEEAARRQGRVLGPQTVIWRLYAHSPEEAIRKAIKSELVFTYRKEVKLFEPPILITPMSNEKKLIRKNFRDACYKRDGYRCAMCGMKSSKEKAEKELDAHHVTDRNLLPNGGYVKENGISLCAECHIKAEVFHSTGTAHPGYSPEDLYKKINSSLEKAKEASEKLI